MTGVPLDTAPLPHLDDRLRAVVFRGHRLVATEHAASRRGNWRAAEGGWRLFVLFAAFAISGDERYRRVAAQFRNGVATGDRRRSA